MKILYFGASWCNQCKAMKPNFENEVKRLIDAGKHIEVEHIDADDKEELCAVYGVRNLPTLIFLKDNGDIERASGLMAYKEIEKHI